MSFELSGATLTLDHVRKEYGKHVAVADVSLEIASGEFVTLLGPSGSGKTTILNMIAGFVTPTRGSIRLNQEPIEQLPPYRRDIGVVFQDYALFPHMTAFENVAFPLRRRRVSKDAAAARAAEALSLVRLGDRSELLPAQLSGGQRQRVALARAIVFGPRLLLMDEPLGALDRILREALQVEIRRIHREVGITVLYVTHDCSEAFALSNRIAIFNQGRIEQLGTGDDLYESPVNLFVADLLGETNAFAGALDETGGLFVLAGSRIEVRAPHAAGVGGTAGTLMVRPERVEVFTAGDPNVEQSEVALLRGRVIDVRPLGADRKVWVAIDEGLVVASRQRASGAGANIGDEVFVGWGRDAGSFLEREGRSFQMEGEDPGDA